MTYIVSLQVFGSVLKEQNISIQSPKKYQCDLCESFRLGHVTEEDYNLNRLKPAEAREAKAEAKAKAESNPEHLAITMDVQSVLTCLKLLASAVYYKMKLQVHNFSIYELNDGRVQLYLWDEVNGGLTASEFTSCVIDYLTDRIEAKGNKEVTIVSDGCGYQNRNNVLASALSDFAMKNNVIITHIHILKKDIPRWR